MSETHAELSAVADAHGWTLDGIEFCELVPPDIEGEDNRQTIFRPSEVELGETVRLLFDEVERIDPARIVIDSLSEMRLVAQNSLRYRRQIFASSIFWRAGAPPYLRLTT
jgi:circadian clock protein KaiC